MLTVANELISPELADIAAVKITPAIRLRPLDLKPKLFPKIFKTTAANPIPGEATRARLPYKYPAIHPVLNGWSWGIYPFCDRDVRAVSLMFNLRAIEFGKRCTTCVTVIMVPFSARGLVTLQAKS